MAKITVGWMYPNLLNLHGERGSVQALEEIGKRLGIEMEILRIEDFDDPIPFESLDLMLFLPGEIHEFQYLIPALQSDSLRKYLDKGGTFQLYKLSNLTMSIPFVLHSCRKLDGSENKKSPAH